MTKDRPGDLREWVDYHHALGVTKFYVFDTDQRVPNGPILQVGGGWGHVRRETCKCQRAHPAGGCWVMTWGRADGRGAQGDTQVQRAGHAARRQWAGRRSRGAMRTCSVERGGPAGLHRQRDGGVLPPASSK